jgi:hypothetical protein
MSSSRVIFACCALVAVVSCTSDEDDSQACEDPSACGPTATIKLDLPPTLSFGDLEPSTITVCRNDLCFSGAFASINAPPSPNTGVGIAIASAVDGGVDGSAQGTGASALLMATQTGTFWLQVFWPLGLGGAPADGDQYKVTVVDGTGMDVITPFEKAATYDTSQPFGKECPTTCQNVVFDEHTS